MHMNIDKRNHFQLSMNAAYIVWKLNEDCSSFVSWICWSFFNSFIDFNVLSLLMFCAETSILC